VSRIMDRLREVEGAQTPGLRTETRSAAADSPESSPEKARPQAPRAAVARYLLPAVAVFVGVFVVWKMWKGEESGSTGNPASRPGKQAGSSGRIVAMTESQSQGTPATPSATVSAANVPEDFPGDREKVPTTPESSPAEQAVVSPQASVASLTEMPGRGGSPREGDSAAPPISSPPQEAPAVKPPVGAVAPETLSPEEDASTKSYLRGLKVSGVYKDANGFVALIDGRARQKGDRLGQVEVSEISSQRIVFVFKGKRYNMRIP